jgi:linoleoyl-CoA desaturase
MASPKFSNTSQSFHTELKKRISDYFKQVGNSSTGNFSLYLKAGILIVSFLLVYTHLVFYTPATWLAIIECVVLGGLTAAIGFNIMHDGLHGSFSQKKWVNEMAGLTLNFLGANNFMWRNKHNIIHHT